jgi:hypothetical protein
VRDERRVKQDIIEYLEERPAQRAEIEEPLARQGHGEPSGWQASLARRAPRSGRPG